MSPSVLCRSVHETFSISSGCPVLLRLPWLVVGGWTKWVWTRYWTVISTVRYARSKYSGRGACLPVRLGMGQGCVGGWVDTFRKNMRLTFTRKRAWKAILFSFLSVSIYFKEFRFLSSAASDLNIKKEPAVNWSNFVFDGQMVFSRVGVSRWK